MTDEPETGHFRGAGGGIFEMPLPLSENMQNQLTRGELTRVNADGSAYEAHGAMDLTNGTMRVPGVNAPKNEWVGYAVSQGVSINDADAMTKNDLIEKFGKK
jgi:hypothetical protein